MDEKEKFLLFLQDYPEYYSVIKSNLFVSLIDFIREKPKSITEIYSNFSKIERKDLDELLNTLKGLNLATSVRSTENLLWKTTSKGVELMKKFHKFRKYVEVI